MTFLHTEALDLQHDLEDAGAIVGAQKYLSDQAEKAEREGFERRDDVQKVIRGAIPIVAEAIRSWAVLASGKKGRPSTALAPMKRLDADVVALLALSVTFNKLGKNPGILGISMDTGRLIQIEMEALALQEADKKAASKFQELANGEARSSVNRKRHERLVEELGVGLDWSRKEHVLIGGTVLNILLTAIPEIFERRMVLDKRGTTPSVAITEEATTVLAGISEAAAWLRPVLQPMVVKPRTWTHLDTGAYLDYRLSRTVPLVRTFSREHRKVIAEAIKDGSMAECIEGLNIIQDTRFAIDKRVLEIVEWTREAGLRPGVSFPASSVPALPGKTPKEEWDLLDIGARSALSRRRKTIRDLRGTAAVDGGMFVSDMAVAGLLSETEAFYLPHNMDFRGRVYSVPHFNPQRTDHVKALFHFADAVPMGPDGGRWLMIHLANCGDFGKVSKDDFDARVQWVRDNEGDILLCAAAPRDTFDIWGEADKPFGFLQACFEYAAWQQSNFSPEFLSTIAVALDGSCSGLQHYAAMTRSAEEGYHVNLLPRDKPGDIYRVVADQARPTLEVCAHQNEDAALILSNGFDRGDVKRNVMTYFYGSGKFGMRDQHMVDTMRPLQDKVALGEVPQHPYALMTDRTNKETGEVTRVLDGGFKCASTLAAHVYAAVTTVAPKADEAASWFQSVAATLAHESLPVIWRTPVGLPVIQRYSEYVSKKVNLWLYDRKVSVPSGLDKTDDAGNVLTRVEMMIHEAPTKRIGNTYRDAYKNACGMFHMFRSVGGENASRGITLTDCHGRRGGTFDYSHGGSPGAEHRTSDILRGSAKDCKVICNGGNTTKGFNISGFRAYEVDTIALIAQNDVTVSDSRIHMRKGGTNLLANAFTANGARLTLVNTYVNAEGISLDLVQGPLVAMTSLQKPSLIMRKSAVVGIIGNPGSLRAQMHLTMDDRSYLGKFDFAGGNTLSEFWIDGTVTVLGPDSNGEYGSILECGHTAAATIRAAYPGVAVGVETGIRRQTWTKTVLAADLTYVALNAGVNALSWVNNGDTTATVTTNFNYSALGFARAIKIAGLNAAGADYYGTVRSWNSSTSITVSPVPTGTSPTTGAITSGFFRPTPFKDPVPAYVSTDGLTLNMDTTGLTVGLSFRVSNVVAGKPSYGVRQVVSIAAGLVTLSQACAWKRPTTLVTHRAIATPTTGTGRSLPAVSVSWGFPIQQRWLVDASFTFPKVEITRVEDGVTISSSQTGGSLIGTFPNVGLVSLAYNTAGTAAAYTNMDYENGYLTQGVGAGPGDIVSFIVDVDVAEYRLSQSVAAEFAGWMPSTDCLAGQRKLGPRPF